MGNSRLDNQYNLKDFYSSITQVHPLRYGHQFTVEFLGSSLAGIETNYFNGNVNSYDNITYFIQSTTIPQVEITSAKVNYFAAGFEVPGVVKYPESWEVDILLDENLTQYRRLQEWMEAMSSYTKSQGGAKKIPNVIARVNLLDSTMKNVVKQYVMEGVWIQQLGAVSFEYQEGASSPLKCKATFTFQYWYDVDNGDPLNAGSVATLSTK